MSRNISLLLCFAAILCFAGCGAGDTAPAPTDAAGDQDPDAGHDDHEHEEGDEHTGEEEEH